jgi:hypothetical protein
LIDNQDGTYSLSLSNLNGPLENSPSFNVKVFSNATCSVSADVNTKFTLDPQTNVYNLSQNEFTVNMDSNFNATFSGPKLVTKSDKLYMVAYLVNNSKTYLYTASTPVSIIYARYPILTVSFDTANTFIPADLNKIVNVTDSLELNNLLDLSGYLVKSISAGIDLSCNLLLPSWDLVGPTLTFTLKDSSGVVKSMDISSNVTKRSNIIPNTSSVFNNLSDVSNNVGFYIDLSFNAVKTQSIFFLDIVLGDAAGNSYPAATKSISFYYPGTFPTFATNPGGKKNTLIKLAWGLD